MVAFASGLKKIGNQSVIPMHGRHGTQKVKPHLVVDGDEGVVRGEGPGGALAVDQQRLGPAVHHVLLHLGNVVGNVVDHVHVQVVGRGRKHLGEGLRAEGGGRRRRVGGGG